VPRFLAIFFLLALLATASTATDIARQLQQATLDPDECYRVIELNFNKEDVKVYLTSGYLIFTQPIAGVRTSAVFVAAVEGGDAEVLLLPPMRSERLSLANFTESPNLDEHFKAAVLVFSDATAAELLSRVQPSAKKSPEMGALIAEKWTSVLRNLSGSFQTRLVYDLLSGDRASGFFYLAVTGDQLGNFDVLYDPTNHEQVFAGKLTYRENRTYFDDWTSFPSRSVRNGAQPPGPKFVLDDFRIESTIQPDLTLQSVTRVTLTPKRKLGSAIPFYISENMRVTKASIDGQPAEVFVRESLRSNLIAGSENQEFLLIPAAELDPTHPHEIEIHHEGEVILKAGNEVYYVASRGNWYPRLGMEFSNYDLTFKYPKNLTLVAAGSLADDRVEGNTRITRRKTESPIRFAGFNLGDFQSVSIAQDGYKIDVYANRHLEAALQPKASAAPPMPMISGPFNRPRRPGDLLSEAAPQPPNPAARLELLAKDVAGALDFMTAQFGPPPLRNLAVTPIPGRFGQGFPGLVYLSTLAYIDPEQRPAALRERSQQTFFSELIEAHEVAHQWWGNLVLPASYQDEWLMESLANYSALLLLEKRKGIKAVDTVLDDYRNHLLTKPENDRTLESAGPITWGYRLQSSLAPTAWRAVTYEKGTWIIHMLRRRLGDQKFLSLLREVCNRYRFNTITTEQFRELAAKYTAPNAPDANLKAFFENWVYGTGIPTVKVTYLWRGLKLTGTISQRGVEDDFSALVPVEVQTRGGKTVHWLPTGSDPVPFSFALKTAPTKVALLSSDCLLTSAK
jgi:hypothetical protein